MKPTFGKKTTVQAQCGKADAAAWNTIREWTGPRATVNADLRAIAARIAR